jgi:hypothetical protein
MYTEIRPLREVLAQQAIGILVSAALPWLRQSLPKTADSSPAVLPEADPVTATVLARIDLNGAFA